MQTQSVLAQKMLGRRAKNIVRNKNLASTLAATTVNTEATSPARWTQHLL